MEVFDGGSALAPEAPVIEGHTFIGWEGEFTDVSEDVTISPKYEINTYTITFKDVGGKELGKETVRHGDRANAPNIPNVTNVTEDMWDQPLGNIQSDGVITLSYAIISTADDLNNVRDNLNGKYIQVNDIDLIEITNFEPIGTLNSEFKGTFDGGGYVISNLKINRGSTNDVGLFGQAMGATLTNIGLVNVNVSGGGHVGGLVGWQDGSSVSDSYATGSVKGSYDVGGLVGWQGTSSEVLNSYATVTVTGNSQIGGLVGNQQSSSKVLNSYAMGSVTGGGSFTANTGGLVGYQQSSSTVTNSYATGSVNSGSRSNIGGLVGHNNGSSTVRNSYYDRNTTGQSDAGKGTGKSTDEMKKKATYTGWDSDTVWQIIDGQYPTLR